MEFEEDDETTDQGRWDAQMAKLSDGQTSKVVRALFEGALAAKATRASLSPAAQALLGDHIPESFFTEVYPLKRKELDKSHPAVVAEIRAAIGLCKTSNWDFGDMTVKEILATPPSALKRKAQS